MVYQRATIRSIYGSHMIKNVPQSSKSSKGSEYLFLFKGGWSVLIKRLSIKVTLRSLLLLAIMEKGQNQITDCKINDVLWQNRCCLLSLSFQ